MKRFWEFAADSQATEEDCALAGQCLVSAILYKVRSALTQALHRRACCSAAMDLRHSPSQCTRSCRCASMHSSCTCMQAECVTLQFEREDFGEGQFLERARIAALKKDTANEHIFTAFVSLHASNFAAASQQYADAANELFQWCLEHHPELQQAEREQSENSKGKPMVAPSHAWLLTQLYARAAYAARRAGQNENYQKLLARAWHIG